MKNLTYQALSDENDNKFLSFEESVNLTHSIVSVGNSKLHHKLVINLVIN